MTNCITYLEIVLSDAGWEVDLTSMQVVDGEGDGRGSSFMTSTLGRDEVMDLVMFAKEERWDSQKLFQYLEDSEFFVECPEFKRAS